MVSKKIGIEKIEKEARIEKMYKKRFSTKFEAVGIIQALNYGTSSKSLVVKTVDGIEVVFTNIKIDSFRVGSHGYVIYVNGTSYTISENEKIKIVFKRNVEDNYFINSEPTYSIIKIEPIEIIP